MKRLVVVVLAVVAVSLLSTAVGGGSLLPGGGPEGDEAPRREGDDQRRAGPDSRGAAGATPTTAPPAVVDVNQVQTSPGTFVLLSPALAAPGSTINVTGQGFDPGATVHLTFRAGEATRNLGFAEADESGKFSADLTIPEDLHAGRFAVAAQQHGGGKSAQTDGTVQADAPEVEFASRAGTQGESIPLSGRRFAPNETVRVYVNTTDSDPIAEYRADPGGALGSQALTLPYFPLGTVNFIFVGRESRAPAVAQAAIIGRTPFTVLSSYTPTPGTVMTFTGGGFAPGETVDVYVASQAGEPLGAFTAGDDGAYAGAVPFRIPPDMTGQQTFILVGRKSRAVDTETVDVSPLTPGAEPSLYAAGPGDEISFSGRGFMPNEVVHVRTAGDGREVACFKADGAGEFSGAGRFVVPGGSGPAVTLTLTGGTSGATAGVTVEIVVEDAGEGEAGADAAPFSCPHADDPAPRPDATPTP